MARSDRSRIRATLELLTLAFGLFLLLELSARLYLFGTAGLLPERINSIRGLPQTGFTQPAPVDSGRIFDLKPKLDGYFKMVPFRTNRFGLRDREYELQKPENTFRVAVLGSSFALPAGVPIEQAFHSRLEERLARELAPQRFEFINFAVGMYNLFQVLATLETRALAFEPDLILVTATELSTPWLIRDRPTRLDDLPADTPLLADQFRRSYPVLRSFFVRLFRHRTGLAPASPQTQIGLLERFYMDLSENWTKAEGGARESTDPTPESAGIRAEPAREPKRMLILERLASIHRQTGIPVAIVRLEFDAKAKTDTDLAVEERARRLGIPYLDTREAFEGTRAPDFWIFEFDPHPNGRAHEIFAQVIGTFLRENDLLPE